MVELADHEDALTVSTFIDLARGATASLELQAAHGAYRPYVQWSRVKGGTGATMVLKIGTRTVLSAAAAATSDLPGPMIGLPNEAITIEHVGATGNGEYQVMCGLIDVGGSAA
ncbi:MAG: hypothetical protein ACE5FA_00060 [Dehalococcoidia bacterium]